ncbi:hypothetical protein [Anditalea andensis]|uniref:3-keto-disaccharide hydrolase domain-containing protein n=1 Tax=Anditalea andensis TaxID=1048983 RepID=A0A074L3D2_9BACT|nr:hypothetical protein [Anditalea andensis]KEO75659.1 hypothetical protein EL17_23860 [Anditalea andensis]
MKLNAIPFVILTMLLTSGTFHAHGQVLKSIKKSVEKKIEKEADKVINGSSSAKNQSIGGGPNEDILAELPEKVYDFTSGSVMIFEDDFSSETAGSMPKKWKSSGGGSVVQVPGVPGNWLQFHNKNNYKIAEIDELPENFTVTFDVLTRLEKASIGDDFFFGFHRSNQLNDDWFSAVAGIRLNYWGNSSNIKFVSEVGKKDDFKFPLGNYARRVMRVEIEVTNGSWMKVYVDQYKVLDTEMMYPDSAKYFFINAPGRRMERNDRVYVSNVKIAAIE